MPPLLRFVDFKTRSTRRLCGSFAKGSRNKLCKSLPIAAYSSCKTVPMKYVNS